jgi:hypothetical protein
MPTRKVGFSQLFAFGAGVAVGANWPRASNFVGFILQRLGFELTDLAIWMWDPEKSAVRTPENPPVRRSKAKKGTEAPLNQAGSRSKKRGRAKARKTAQAPGIQSGAAIIRATGKKTTNGHEPWIRPDRTNGSAVRTNGMPDSPLMRSGNSESRAVRTKSTIDHDRWVQPGKRVSRNECTKAKSTAVKNKRKTSASRSGAQFSTFSAAVLPAAAALN